jgi:ABC-type dipeptide/oligopeptide/nickel transport system permease component
MWVYIVERVLRTLITLLFAVTMIFFAIRVLPGDPAEALLGRHISVEGLETIRRQMGLDRSVLEQYVIFLGNLLQGDLGTSLAVGEPVSKLLLDVAPYTAVVVLGALLIGALIGIPLGIASAIHRNRAIDYLARFVSLGGISLPGFVIAILLMLPLAVQLRWFPLVGGGDVRSLGSLVYYGFLPALAGGVGMAAYLTRLTRSAFLEVLSEDYIRTARAKGLPERRVLYKHALRNALIPIVTLLGLYAIIMIGDSITIEIVFSRPGFGRLIMGGITQRDYIVLQSVLLVYVAIAAILNLVVDLLYAVIDPRIEIAGRTGN